MKKQKPDETAHIKYLEMGPFPVFVGVTCSEPRFKKEMARIGCPGTPFIGGSDHANATTHQFFNSKHGALVIVTLRKKDGVTKEQVAALAAHEAVHVLQYIKGQISPHDPLGVEPEAYIVQTVVQGLLEEVWATGRTRAKKPG